MGVGKCMSNFNKKCLLTYDYGEEKTSQIEALGYDIIVRREKNITYSEEFEEVDVLVCYNPFETLDISLMKSLKWIQLSSIGIDQLPSDKVLNQHITVTNNRGGYSVPMGEWIVLNILEMYKRRLNLYKKIFNKKWKIDTDVLELYGKTVGFIGTGSIAIEGAKRLQGFGVNIIGMNTDGRSIEYFDHCYSKDEFYDLLEKSDVLVITIPYTEATHHLISKKELSMMKENALIINVSRGSILDEKALINELKKGRLMGAALDVFEEEPLQKNSPLWDIENVFISPHNSWVSEMRNERRFNLIYDNLRRYAEGKPLLNVINIEKGY